MSCTMLIPVTFFMEYDLVADALLDAYGSYPGGKSSFRFDVAICGLTYYWYNEMAYLVLGSLDSAVSAAVGNTIKRVVVLVATTLYFKTPMSGQSIVGCSIAIGGVLLYSVVSDREKQRKKAAERARARKVQ